MKLKEAPLPKLVSQEEWQTSLSQLLEQEKKLTRARDELNSLRRNMPMTAMSDAYVFRNATAKQSLLDLFDGRKQLIIYHFMFDPDWQAGCPGCSWVVDAMSHPAHLHARDTNMVIVARAPFEKLEAYRQRMEWAELIPWYSSFDSEFNQDCGVTDHEGEHHGVSVFIRDGSQVFRSYYSGARGVEYLGSHWSYLDLTPYGRMEPWESSPEGWPQGKAYEWIQRHDEYEHQNDTPIR